MLGSSTRHGKGNSVRSVPIGTQLVGDLYSMCPMRRNVRRKTAQFNDHPRPKEGILWHQMDKSNAEPDMAEVNSAWDQGYLTYHSFEFALAFHPKVAVALEKQGMEDRFIYFSAWRLFLHMFAWGTYWFQNHLQNWNSSLLMLYQFDITWYQQFSKFSGSNKSWRCFNRRPWKSCYFVASNITACGASLLHHEFLWPRLDASGQLQVIEKCWKMNQNVTCHQSTCKKCCHLKLISWWKPINSQIMAKIRSFGTLSFWCFRPRSVWEACPRYGSSCVQRHATRSERCGWIGEELPRPKTRREGVKVGEIHVKLTTHNWRNKHEQHVEGWRNKKSIQQNLRSKRSYNGCAPLGRKKPRCTSVWERGKSRFNNFATILVDV